MRHLISAFPDVALPEFEARLEALLRQWGGSICRRLQHPHGEVFPTLSQALADAAATADAAVQAWSFYAPEPACTGSGATVLHLFGQEPVAWHAGHLQTLSRAFDGWALGLLSDRHREEHALAACYAGATVEGAAWTHGGRAWQVGPAAPPPQAGEGLWPALVAQYRAVSGASSYDLRWSPDVTVHSWLVTGLGGDADRVAPPPEGQRVRRAAFLEVQAAQVQAAMTPATALQLRLQERLAPVTQLPYVLLDGDFDDAWFAALAQRLDVPATAVDLDPAEARFTWCEVRGPQQVRTGEGRGTVALANLWSRLTLYLGEPGCIVRWSNEGPGAA